MAFTHFNLYFTHHLVSENAIPCIGNSCLWALRRAVVIYKPNENTYCVLKEQEPPWIVCIKKITSNKEFIQPFISLSFGALSTSLGLVCKSISLFYPSDREKYSNYMKLKIQEKEVVFYRNSVNFFEKNNNGNLFVDSIFFTIMEYLDLKDLKSVFNTCKTWRQESTLKMIFRKKWTLANVPFHLFNRIPLRFLPRRTTLTTNKPIQCIALDDMKHDPVILGYIDKNLFAVVRYLYGKGPLQKMGITAFSYDKENKKWKNYNHRLDTLNLGETIEDFPSFLTDLCSKTPYKSENGDVITV